MSLQEKRTLSYMISSLLIFGGYCLYVYRVQLGSDLGAETSLVFWAQTLLWLIPVAIVGRIVLAIVFAIVHRMATGEDAEDLEDERDKLFELKAERITNYLFMIGFFAGVGAIAMQWPGYYLFIIVALSGFVAEQVGYLAKLRYYRQGV